MTTQPETKERRDPERGRPGNTTPSRARRAMAALGILVLFLASPFPTEAAAGPPIVEATLEPDRDNTLYEDAGGAFSNGEGQLFAGLTAGRVAGGPALRRALLRFDIDGTIPAGATILDATLTLFATREVAGDRVVSIHRVLADWGEGTSRANGRGAPATPGDATWIHTFFDGSFWAAVGGDFDPVASDATVVGGSGRSYDWSVRADVQAMLDDPTGNFGWVLLGDESVSPSAKRFGSRENTDTEERPSLRVVYTLEPAIETCQGPGTEVLRVNGSTGAGPGRTVEIDAAGPIEFSMDRPDAGGPGRFLATLEVGVPSTSSLDFLPDPFGISCFSFLLSRGAAPAARWNSIGKVDRLGESVFFGTPQPSPRRAPTAFFESATGDPNLMPGNNFTLQGAIIDPDANPRRVRLTNAIVVSVR